eukprot:446816_1
MSQRGTVGHSRNRITNQHTQGTATNTCVISHIDIVNNKQWHVGSKIIIFDDNRHKGVVQLLHLYPESDRIILDDGTKIVGKIGIQWSVTVNTDTQHCHTYAIIHLWIHSNVSELRGDYSLAPVPNSSECIEGRRLATQSHMNDTFDYYTTTNGIDAFTRQTSEEILKKLRGIQVEHHQQKKVLPKQTKADVDSTIYALFYALYKGVTVQNNLQKAKSLLVSIQSMPNVQNPSHPSASQNLNATNTINNTSNISISNNNNANPTNINNISNNNNTNTIQNNNGNGDGNGDGDGKKKAKIAKIKCPHCDKKYTKYYLNTHIKHKHESETTDWVACGLNGCEHAFKDNDARIRHQKQSIIHINVNGREQIQSCCPKCTRSVLRKSASLNVVFCSDTDCSYNHKYIGDNAVYPYKN